MHPCSEAVPCAAALTWRHDTQQNQLIAGQGPLQALLLLIAFISVPMMLLPKPFLLKREHEAKVARRGGFQPLGHEADEEAGACLLYLPFSPAPMHACLVAVIPPVLLRDAL